MRKYIWFIWSCPYFAEDCNSIPNVINLSQWSDNCFWIAFITCAVEMLLMQCASVDKHESLHGSTAYSGCSIVDCTFQGPNRRGELWCLGDPDLGWQQISMIDVPTAAARCMGPPSLPINRWLSFIMAAVCLNVVCPIKLIIWFPPEIVPDCTMAWLCWSLAIACRLALLEVMALILLSKASRFCRRVLVGVCWARKAYSLWYLKSDRVRNFLKTASVLTIRPLILLWPCWELHKCHSQYSRRSSRDNLEKCRKERG